MCVPWSRGLADRLVNLYCGCKFSDMKFYTWKGSWSRTVVLKDQGSEWTFWVVTFVFSGPRIFKLLKIWCTTVRNEKFVLKCILHYKTVLTIMIMREKHAGSRLWRRSHYLLKYYRKKNLSGTLIITEVIKK